MPTQEICHLEYIPIINKGFLGNSIDYNHCKYRIVQPTSTGNKILHETRILDRRSGEQQQEHARLQASLLADGWRLVDVGHSIFAREIPDIQANQIEGKEDVLATIERLAHLRDVGAITEDEYQKKKDELMGRI